MASGLADRSHVLSAALALSFALSGCAREHVDVASLSRAATPHLGEFDRLDRWLRRGVAAEPGFRSQAMLEEALRAPLRGEESLVAAWVKENEREVFAYGDAPRPEVRWTRVSDGEHDVMVARAPVDGELCVLVSRRDDDVDVTVAYASPDQSVFRFSK